MDKKFFYFNEFCHFIKGGRKASVYNLLNGEVYALDEFAADILDNGNASVAEKLRLAVSRGQDEGKVFQLLEELVSSGLGRFSDKALCRDQVSINLKENLLDKGKIDLKELIIKVNNKCGLNCFFCEKDQGKLCFPCNRLSANFPANRLVENYDKILADAVLLGCDTLRFTGGDPFLEGVFFLRMLSEAAEKIPTVEVVSNLSSITVSQREALGEFGNVHIFFPLFGNTRQVYGEMTGKDALFDKVVENALDLKNRGVEVTALIMRRKDFKVEDCIAFCESRDLVYRVFSPTPLSMDKEVLAVFDGFAVTEGDFPDTDFNRFFWNKIYHGCLGQAIVVDTDGDVKSCWYSGEVFGNLGSESLRNILREGKQDPYWFLSKDQIEGCRSCEFRYCCRSACMAAAKNINGKMDAGYPFCCYDPEEGVWSADLSSP